MFTIQDALKVLEAHGTIPKIPGFVPIEQELADDHKTWPEPVRWYEGWRERTGMGLAYSWSLVRSGDLKAAEESFKNVVVRYAQDHA